LEGIREDGKRGGVTVTEVTDTAAAREVLYEEEEEEEEEQEGSLWPAASVDLDTQLERQAALLGSRLSFSLTLAGTVLSFFLCLRLCLPVRLKTANTNTTTTTTAERLERCADLQLGLTAVSLLHSEQQDVKRLNISSKRPKLEGLVSECEHLVRQGDEQAAFDELTAEQLIGSRLDGWPSKGRAGQQQLVGDVKEEKRAAEDGEPTRPAAVAEALNRAESRRRADVTQHEAVNSLHVALHDLLGEDRMREAVQAWTVAQVEPYLSAVSQVQTVTLPPSLFLCFA
jgi:hypothetical protein